VDHDIGTAGTIGPTPGDPRLLEEVDVAFHAGLLQDPPQLDLSPCTAHRVVAQGPRELPGLGPDLVAAAGQLLHGVGEHRALGAALRLELAELGRLVLELLDDLGALGLPMTERRGLQRLVTGTGQLEELFGLLLKGGARHRAVGLEELVIGSDRRFGRHDPLPQRRALFG